MAVETHRLYDIRVSDANDNTCVFFSNLSWEQAEQILTTMVPVSMHFISVNIILVDNLMNEG